MTALVAIFCLIFWGSAALMLIVGLATGITTATDPREKAETRAELERLGT